MTLQGHVHVSKSSQPCKHVWDLLRCLLFWAAKKWLSMVSTVWVVSSSRIFATIYHSIPKSLAPEVWVRNGSDHLGQPGHGWCWTGDGLVYSGFLRASWQMGSVVRIMFSYVSVVSWWSKPGKGAELYKLWCFHESWVTAYMMCYCYFDEGGKTKLHPNFSKNNRWSSPRKKMVDSPTRNECLVGGFKHFLFSIIYGTMLPID